MLTHEEFDSLQVGDRLDTVPLFPGLDSEPVSLRVSKISIDPARIEFVASYMGVTLGRWACQADPNGILAWSFG